MFDRRSFLTFLGGAATGSLATPLFWNGLQDLSTWTQSLPPEVDSGSHNAMLLKTVSKLCPSATGMSVRLVDDRPVHVQGDPDSPLSRGGISALAASEVQLRQSPSRVRHPLFRDRKGVWHQISWEEAGAILLGQCSKVKGSKEFVCISGDKNGTLNELYAGFTHHMGSDSFFLVPDEVLPTATAWQAIGGKGRVGYDLPHSDFVLAVGASVLESWGTSVCHRQAWGQARPAGSEPAMRLAYAGPIQNGTASVADWWLPIKPNMELFFLIGVIHHLLDQGMTSSFAGLEDLRTVAAPWSPARVCDLLGLSLPRFYAVVAELAKARSPLVIVGTDIGQGGGCAPLIAGMSINMLLGRVNGNGGMRAIPTPRPVIQGAPGYEAMAQANLMAYINAVAKGNANAGKMLLFCEANPVYALPQGTMDTLFSEADFSVSFASFLDETARCCDLVLPAALGLERYDDVSYPHGYGETIHALVQPVAEPVDEARPTGDVILGLAQSLGFSPGFEDVVEILQAKAKTVGADWDTLSNGETFQNRTVVPIRPVYRADLIAPALGQLIANMKQQSLRLALTSRLAFGVPESAIPPSSTVLITDQELEDGVLVARANRATLQKYNLKERQMISLYGNNGKIRVCCMPFEGVAHDTIALTMGFGHNTFAYNQGLGSNARDLLSVRIEPGTGMTTWTGNRVDIQYEE